MESQAKYVLVGSFVIVSFVLLLLSLLWIAGIAGAEQAKYYTVYFRQQSLDGLQKDSVVTMRGIKVGTIANYEISPKNIEQIKATLRLEEGTPVKTDTRAVLRRNLLTGLAKVDLIGSTQESPLLLSLRESEEFPVIPEGIGGLEQITNSIPEVLEQVNRTVGRLEFVMSEENIKSFSSALKNVEAFTENLAKNSNRIESLLREIEIAAGRTKQISEDLHQFVEDIKPLGQESTLLVREVRATSSDLKRDVSEMMGGVRFATQQVSQDISVAAQSFADASRALGRAAEGFENPRGIITGPSEDILGPGEKLSSGGGR